jgi:hypothetical protein
LEILDYITIGYLWLLYWWLLLVTLLVAIGLLVVIDYSIDAYSFGASCIDDYWLLFYWCILMVIGNYYSASY